MERGYNVLGVFLQGSQNYNLEWEQSDIDTKAIVLPSLSDIIHNKTPTSITSVLPSNEHIDVKDIRLMFECFKKQNINFVEILFTKYKHINIEYKEYFQPMLDNNEKIAHYNNYASVNCISGMSMEKYKALEHPYPSIIEKIEKYGHDCKQLHHIVRMNEFIRRYLNGEPYKNCLISNNRKNLLKIKSGFYSLKNARILAKLFDDDTRRIKNEYMANNPLVVDQEVEKIMYDVIEKCIKYSIKKEIMNE
jgi:predicted nucleotidyltransferase